MSNFLIKTNDDYITREWSGGKTTELFIYPENSDYLKRDFDFRVSTATIETEKSDFTKLNGYTRQITTLDNPIALHHKNHHSKDILPFQIDIFEGDWETSSVGKCADFNLMYSKEYEGTLKAISSTERIQVKNDNFILVYSLDSGLKITTTYSSSESITSSLEKGSMFIVQSLENSIESILLNTENCKTSVQALLILLNHK